LKERMGRDKAFLKFKDGTFLRNILESVSKRCDEIVIVGNKDEYLYLNEAKGIKKNIYFTKDIHPYEGPLNGIISALPFVNGERVFIATCDTPLISPEIIDLLNDEINGFDAVIPVINGKFQPLNTIYKKRAFYWSINTPEDYKRLISSSFKKTWS